MRTHPNESDLALYAGHDLGFVAEWRVRRHVARCEECRETVAAFELLPPEIAGLGDLPAGIGWNRLASEMKANIRVGLEAGECVGAVPESGGRWSLPALSGVRTLVAYASLIALVVAGVWLQRPSAPVAQSHAVESGATVLAATHDGVEVNQGGHSLGLRYGDSRDVNYSADAKGSVGARYVDSNTGYLTVVNVNLE